MLELAFGWQAQFSWLWYFAQNISWHEVCNDAFEKEVAWLLLGGLGEFKQSFWKCLNDCLKVKVNGTPNLKIKSWHMARHKVKAAAGGFCDRGCLADFWWLGQAANDVCDEFG